LRGGGFFGTPNFLKKKMKKLKNFVEKLENYIIFLSNYIIFFSNYIIFLSKSTGSLLGIPGDIPGSQLDFH